MAKTTVKHGAVIDAVSPEEMEQMLKGRQAGHGGLFDVTVGDFPTPEPVLLTNPPMRRLRVSKSAAGGDAIVVPVANAVKLLGQEEGRLGGQLVNYGANALFIYFCALSELQGSQLHARPAMWIAGNGGRWDFQVSGLVWGGSVSAQALVADTNVTLSVL